MLLVVALAAVAGSLLAPLPAAAEARSARQADARLERGLERLVRLEVGPPGAAALIDRGAGARLHRAGLGFIARGRPIRRRDHMRIASVAKAFNGAVALSLVDRGELGLDDTIGERLPDLPAAWSDVTLRQALNHTAGLPDYILDEEFRERFSRDPRQHFSPRELIDFIADEPLLFRPGSQYEYSDTDNIVVGLMAEAATGLGYETLLQQLVYDRLGLVDTSLPSGFRLPRPFIHGYDVARDRRPENISQVLSASGAWASGGIVSTLADLNRFIRGYVGGALFNAPTRVQQLDFVPGGKSGPAGPGRNSAGLGIFRYETRCGTVFGATGNMPGYTAFTASSPDGERSASVAINTQLSESAPRKAFKRLRRAWTLAVCAARARAR